jgi:hypothetical protein
LHKELPVLALVPLTGLTIAAMSVRQRRAWRLLAGCRQRLRNILDAEGHVTGGQPGFGSGLVRFAGTADIDRLLADAPRVRTALLEQGAPTTAFRAADPQLTVLHYDGRRYIRFATAGNGDPVAVKLPSGRVVELVTRNNPPSEIIVSIALYSTSLVMFCQVWAAFAREPFYSCRDFQSLTASGPD